ncbi:hypothetical protein D3C76_736960 [compost metagenome]
MVVQQALALAAVFMKHSIAGTGHCQFAKVRHAACVGGQQGGGHLVPLRECAETLLQLFGTLRGKSQRLQNAALHLRAYPLCAVVRVRPVDPDADPGGQFGQHGVAHGAASQLKAIPTAPSQPLR